MKSRNFNLNSTNDRDSSALSKEPSFESKNIGTKHLQINVQAVKTINTLVIKHKTTKKG
jgi:hypothetical protein